MIEHIVRVMESKTYMLNMGAGNLAKRFHTDRETIYRAKEIIYRSKIKELTLPKILLLDIETAPLEAYLYASQVWKAIIRDDAITSQWFILTWAAKWLGADEIMSGRCTSEEALEENDSRIMKNLWKLLDEAEIVIAHNGDYFDIPSINTRFLVNNMGPTSHYKQIDTLKIARKEFAFTHNSQNALAKLFGIEEKPTTGFGLWKRCKHGNAEALLEMEKYNKHDVEMLEEIYLKLRPWIKSHPNLSLYMNSDVFVCSNCGSTDIKPDGNFFYTHTGKYPTHRCGSCGANTRETKSVRDKSKPILVSIPGR